MLHNTGVKARSRRLALHVWWRVLPTNTISFLDASCLWTGGMRIGSRGRVTLTTSRKARHGHLLPLLFWRKLWNEPSSALLHCTRRRRLPSAPSLSLCLTNFSFVHQEGGSGSWTMGGTFCWQLGFRSSSLRAILESSLRKNPHLQLADSRRRKEMDKKKQVGYSAQLRTNLSDKMFCSSLNLIWHLRKSKEMFCSPCENFCYFFHIISTRV